LLGPRREWLVGIAHPTSPATCRGRCRPGNARRPMRRAGAKTCPPRRPGRGFAERAQRATLPASRRFGPACGRGGPSGRSRTNTA